MNHRWSVLALALLAPVPVAAEGLSDDGLRQRLAGQTFEVRRMAIRMALTFGPDGTISADGPLGEMAGSWRVDGDQLCMELPRMGQRCGPVSAEADGSLVLGDGQRLTPACG